MTPLTLVNGDSREVIPHDTVAASVRRLLDLVHVV